MRVTFRTDVLGEYRGREFVYHNGTTADVPDELAKRWIAKRIATPVRECTAVETPECAVVTPPKRRGGRAKAAV